MKIVDNWKKHLKRYTVQGLAALATLQGAWLVVPDSIKANLPDWLSQGLAIAFTLAILASAFVHQGITDNKNEPN